MRETVLTPELSARHSGTEGRGGCRDKVGVAVGPEEAGRRGGVPVPEGVLGHSAALPGESRGSSGARMAKVKPADHTGGGRNGSS